VHYVKLHACCTLKYLLHYILAVSDYLFVTACYVFIQGLLEQNHFQRKPTQMKLSLCGVCHYFFLYGSY